MRGILRAFWNFLAIRCVRALLVPVTLTGLLTGLETASASPATCVSWSGTPVGNPGVPDNVLTATSVLSPCDAWAVGWNSGTAVNQTLIERWTGMPAARPGITGTGLISVAALPPCEAWAVGSTSNQNRLNALIERWDGTT